MKIIYFAWLKNITNTEYEEIIDNKITNIETLKEKLCQKYPKLKEYFFKNQIIRIAVNLEYTEKNIAISNQDEIALFPPVSGG